MKLVDKMKDENLGLAILYNFTKGYAHVPMSVYDVVLPFLYHDCFRNHLFEGVEVEEALTKCVQEDASFIQNILDTIEKDKEMTSRALGICLLNKYLSFEFEDNEMKGIYHESSILDINEAINAFQNKEIQIFADDKFMYLADDYTFISLRIVNAKELTINTTLKKIETNKDLTKVNVAKNLILGTIKRACLLSTDRKMIRILLKANKETNLLNIQGKSDRGSINEDIEAIIDGKDAEICFNGSYLLEVLNAMDCENTEIRFDAANERTPMLVKNGDAEVVTDSTYAIALLKRK